MNKQISFTSSGTRADIGDIAINRILPNRYADAVGPFVFLDHILPVTLPAGRPAMQAGTGSHPHRGIATLTYVLSGVAEHYDSRGHHAAVHSGGLQWMNAGSGILHDETLNPAPGSGLLHGLQFWINLPPAQKALEPAYLALEAGELPFATLPDEAGWLKVVAGSYGSQVSKVPAYSRQFLYHLHLLPGGAFSLPAEAGIEYAAFLPAQGLTVNDTAADAGDFIEFDREAGNMQFVNPAAGPADVIIFGGETYTDPIVAQGPFVMNTHAEIAAAYTDFFNGAYGTISYDAQAEAN